MKTIQEAHTLWFKQEKFAFIYVPKVACTSWKLFFLRILFRDYPKKITYQNIHSRNDIPLPYLIDMPPEEKKLFETMLHRKEIKVVGVIRDPKQRVLSAYLDKIYYHRNPKSLFSQVIIPEIRNYCQCSETQRPSFGDFLRWVNSQNSKNCNNNHWLPMTKIFGGLLNGHVDLQLYPMVKMKEAVRVVQSHFNSKTPFPTTSALGPRKINNTEGINHTNYYGEEESKIFNAIYAEDIEMYRRINDENKC